MAFTWDPKKNEENIRKHGIAFEVAVHIFDGPTFEWYDRRRYYGEDRYLAVGVVETRVVVVVFTEHGDDQHIISARKAETDERQAYEDYLLNR